MSRKKYLAESPQQWADITTQIVNNVRKTLKDLKYEDSEITSVLSKNNFELDMIDDAFVLYQGNKVVFSKPRKQALLHTFPQEAEDALLNWCIEKIGREPEYIDTEDWFNEYKLNENKYTKMKNTIRLTESELKKIISESVKTILNERIKSELGMSDDEVRYRRNKNYRDDRDDVEYQTLHPYTDFGPSYDNLHDFDYFANPNEMERRTDSARMWKHKTSQNHRYINDDGEYEDIN